MVVGAVFWYTLTVSLAWSGKMEHKAQMVWTVLTVWTDNPPSENVKNGQWKECGKYVRH